MIVGVTGCPGSGKSLLADVLAERGWFLVDADALGREVVEGDGAVLSELASLFGSDILGTGGKLDRRLLARRAFSTPERTLILNRVVHPALIARTCEAVGRLRESGGQGVIDCALIYEWGIENHLDLVVCVRADEDIRRRRLMERDGRTEEEIERMFAAQLPEREKVLRADIVFANNGSPERMVEYGLMLSRLPCQKEEGWTWKRNASRIKRS
jgi:dephospho-CoA kinase